MQPSDGASPLAKTVGPGTLNISGRTSSVVGMKTLKMALLAVVSLSAVALADDYDDSNRPRAPCGTHRQPYQQPPAQNQNGRYELRTTQVWVPGIAQQVWVPGQCYSVNGYGRHHHHRQQQCTAGYYQTVQQQGHYESQQQWVWVNYQQPQPIQYGSYEHHRGQVDIQFGNPGVNGSGTIVFGSR
jgi:hypothetical protein